MNSRFLIATLCCVAAFTVSGCAVTASDPSAAARLAAGPPAPIAEIIPPAPEAGSYWIPGHWRSNGRAYVWSSGRWERARPGMVYQQAYWYQRNGRWTYHAGRWVPADSPLIKPISEVANERPPASAVEVVTVAPAPGLVWVAGYWHWHRGRHVWVPGHWTHAGSRWHFSGSFGHRF